MLLCIFAGIAIYNWIVYLQLHRLSRIRMLVFLLLESKHIIIPQLFLLQTLVRAEGLQMIIFGIDIEKFAIIHGLKCKSFRTEEASAI